jgi:hypothetical protein
MAKVHFDPVSHAYSVDGRRVPSVTGILREMRIYDSYEFTAAYHRLRGHAVHHGCALIDQGQEPTISVPADAPEEIRKAAHDIEHGYWPAFKSWRARTGFQGRCYECSLVDPVLKFGGTFDVWGMAGDEVWLVDLKSGEVLPKMVPCQLSLYELLARNGQSVDPNHPGWGWVQEVIKAGVPIKRKAVRLQRDGTDTMYSATAKGRSYDDPYWTVLSRSAVNVFNGLSDNGLLGKEGE